MKRKSGAGCLALLAIVLVYAVVIAGILYAVPRCDRGSAPGQSLGHSFRTGGCP